MTASVSSPVSPRQRLQPSRKLRYGIALIAICVAGYWVLPWLLMPADLRSIQGTWKIVRLVKRGQEVADWQVGRLVVISGNRIVRVYREESTSFEIRPEQRALVLYEPESAKVLGVDIQVPIWIRRPESLRNPPVRNILHYDLSESRLVIIEPWENPERPTVGPPNPEDSLAYHLTRAP